MPASAVNPDQFHQVIPTPSPQVYVHADGSPISLVVTDNDAPGPLDQIEPDDIRLSQGQTGPAQLVLPDGSAPDMNAAVLTPYSLVTPPGVIVVG